MAALTKERLPDFFGTTPTRRTIQVKGGVKIFKGANVAIDSSGYARPGGLIAAGGVRAVGVAAATADNTGGADGVIEVEVHVGVYKMLNHGADLVTAASVGADCYVVDDQTVALTSATSTRYVAGKVQRVDSDGVRVFFA